MARQGCGRLEVDRGVLDVMVLDDGRDGSRDIFRLESRQPGFHPLKFCLSVSPATSPGPITMDTLQSFKFRICSGRF